MVWSQGSLAARILIPSKSIRRSRWALKPGVPEPTSVRAVKWIGCTNPVCGQMMEASGHLRALFPDPEHDNSPLRHSNCIRVVENPQVLVRPQITSMNRTADAYIFEL